MKHLLFLLLCAIFFLEGCKIDDPTDGIKLPSNIITKIIVDKQGIKWIATDKGLVSFDGENWKTYNSISPYVNQKVSDLVFDVMHENSELWISTYQGVFKNTISNSNLSVTESYIKSITGLVNDTVLYVATDYNSSKYFATPSGLSIHKNSIWTFFDGKWGKNNDNFLVKNKISAIAPAKNGWNYVSTLGGGVSRFKYTDAVSGATKFFMPWAYGLKSDTVFTVVVVNDTCQWYGTTKGVAYHTSEYTKSDWTSYSTVDGLVSDTVYAIAQDVDGSVWFGTHRGASKLKDGVWTSFTTQNGLISNKVNTVAVDNDGSVWFGTDKGISHYKNQKWINIYRESIQ